MQRLRIPLIAAIAAIAAILQACGGGGGGGVGAVTGAPTAGEPQACSIADQRQHVLDFMRDDYYWYSQLPAADDGATTMDAYFQSLLYRPTDRFSFSEPTAAYEQLYQEGTFTGYGYSFVATDPANGVLRVRTVEPKGPAYAAGLRRGDTVISVNASSAAQVIAGAEGPVSDEGVPRTMVVRDLAGNTKTLQMVSTTFALSPVQDVKVLNATRNGQAVKVGYLNYSQFVTHSLADLQSAVSTFAQQGATELVLDLRYNGGGDVATSRDLASLVAGARTAGQLFAGLRYNDRNPANNADYRFIAPVESIPSLARVFVITSGGTASASELVINGLKPFMPVVLVGETTYGKPYGFQPYSYCGTTYNAVNFDVVNAQGVGGYTSGFAPTCPAADDFDHPLGDANENRLKVALGYIATGQCPQAPQSARIGGPAPATLGDVQRPGLVRR